MKININKQKKAIQPKTERNKIISVSLFPRPVCLEKCTMETPRGYETDILMTLKAFSRQETYRRKTPHKLEGEDGIWSLDVSSRNDKYRMLFYVDNGICKITHLCTEETHK
jgi:hypothetical protein